ncbi:MAG: FAD-dependent oxidoreductase [Rhodospirillales bacterium]|nr:FAD-dependent oxidoreductase [Rhodospirillales bacterium]
MIETPVLIVGGGPVGLALAGDLGWRGRDCLLVERTGGEIVQPRQDLVGIRTMEFCRRWGLVGAVEAAPYNRDYPQDNVYIAGSLAGGWEIGRYPSPGMNEARPPPESPCRRERCPQNMFDPILRDFAGSHETVSLRYRHRFLGLRVEGDGAVAEIERTDTGDRLDIRARFVVGCDGAGSAVREAMGVRLLGEPALTYTTNLIFRCDGFEALHDKRPGYRFILLDEEAGTWATIVAINGRDEWRMSIVRSSADGRVLPESEVRDAIRRAVGRDFDYELLSVMPWRRRELVADAFQSGSAGPLFLAGDAAHAMSPTGGFGMNTGVGDAVDLAWKLDAALAGWAGPDLLASYTAERRPVAERNVREASGNLGRMLSPGPQPGLLAPGPEGDKLRARVGHELATAMLREWRTLGIHLGYVYEGSPICVADGTPPPSLDPAVYEPTARPGSRAPHADLGNGRSTLDLFGRGFVLLTPRPSPPDAEPLLRAARMRGVPMEPVALDRPDIARLYGKALVLVRPDGHVAWRGDAPPPDPLRFVDRVRGAG